MSYFLIASMLLVMCFCAQGLATLLFLYERAGWLEKAVLVLTGLMAAAGIALFAVEIFSGQAAVQYRRMALIGAFGLLTIGFIVPCVARMYNHER